MSLCRCICSVNMGLRSGCIYKVILRIALAMVIIVILDYAYQRFEHENS